MPFSRATETEADFIGLQLMAKACFDPREAIVVWERMAKKDAHGVPAFMSTHPSSDTRAENMKSWMNQAMQIRMDNCGDIENQFVNFRKFF